MQLKQLTLSGFKSFVEPTTILFPSPLVAIVGPNGCGKSNIIDAIRWVMGESSAKHLRGDSMVDVIFNGSTQKKSLGQASVELIFDNSLSHAKGQYAAYNELSLKRVVRRDSESFYYLNNARCRRRDVQDVFMGTGVGARGYAIIGQNTIMKLVEARPEELRAHLEEAAGISKYKERRRETLQKIQLTKDNLMRVQDLRNELDKQLSRLERQSNAAKRYKSLKEKERLYKSEILAIKWQHLIQEQVRMQDNIKQQHAILQQNECHLSILQQQQLNEEENHKTLNCNHQQFQAECYEVRHKLAGFEASVSQLKRDKERLLEDEMQLQEQIQSLVLQKKHDEQLLQSCNESYALQTSQQMALKKSFETHERAWEQWQLEDSKRQTLWREVQEHFTQVKQEVAIESTRVSELNKRHEEAEHRLAVIHDELKHIDTLSQQLELDSIEKNKASQLSVHEELLKNHTKTATVVKELREKVIAQRKLLQETEQLVQKRLMDYTACQAALESTLHIYNEHIAEKRPINKDRLIDSIIVEDEWSQAIEMVLGDGLSSFFFESTDTLYAMAPELTNTTSMLVSPLTCEEKCCEYPRLVEKLKGKMPSWVVSLNTVYVAEHLQQALEWLPHLPKQHSIVTKDGCWLGQGWFKSMNLSEHKDKGILKKKNALDVARHSLTQTKQQLATVQNAYDDLKEQMHAHQQLEEQLSQECSNMRYELKLLETTIQRNQHALQQSTSRFHLLSNEQRSLQTLLEELVGERISSSDKLHAKRQEEQRLTKQLDVLETQKKHSELQRHVHWQEKEARRTSLHQLEIECNKITLQSEQLHQNLQRDATHIKRLEVRLNSLKLKLKDLDAANLEYKNKLAEACKQHRFLEAKVEHSTKQLNESQKKLQSFSINIKDQEQIIRTNKETLQQQQLDAHALKIHAETIQNTLLEDNLNAQSIVSQLPAQVTLLSREQELRSIHEKITCLGPVNLVAIEEYEIEFQRKKQLEEQSMDLTQALTTLESAIVKLDRETQLRLKETFAEINAAFQSLFPRLFGGGHAYLQWTCDNLLEAGVLVKAQPPGKRNSTIYMLSGGEKALTAVALVFAMFQLNPAPFCLLDEVDAPLDDVNVGRFTELVKEMSQWVQFLLITHNKVTMEMADHLIGVTMREPGVSRVVAVDVERALSMTRSS